MARKKRAAVVGFPYYAKFLADLMNEHSDHWEMRPFKEQRFETLRALFALRKADALICFGGPAPDAALTEIARSYGVQVVVVWAGSDVIQAQANPQDVQIIKQENFHHIADGAWLVDELAVLGLNVEYEPLTAVRPGKPVVPLPPTFRVLTYLPEPRREFYGAAQVYEIARNMPDVTFTVVGAGGRSPEAPPNVEFLGYVDNMQDVLDSSVVLLRLPQHDGKSMFVLEALARARHVVWNYDFPHVRTARSTQDALEQLQQLRRLSDSGELKLNIEGRELAIRDFGRKQTAARLEARLDALVDRKRPVSTRQRKRVAISGLSIFCADVANYAQTIAPDWDVRLLRTNSRVEMLTSIITLFGCDVWYSIGNPINDGWLMSAARLMHKPRVIHWVGSDILVLGQYPGLRDKLASPNNLHLAEAPWTVRELQGYGILPRMAALPPRHHHGTTLPLPETFTILLYVPAVRADFYGRRELVRLMESLRGKNVRYIAVGGGEIDAPAGIEVTNLGWRNDLQEAYKQASVLIRFTPHDGLSLMVLEALSYGRHVVWTQPFPFVRQVRTYEDIEREVRALIDEHERGTLRPLAEASAYIHNNYSPEACIKALSQAWHDVGEPLRESQLVTQTP